MSTTWDQAKLILVKNFRIFIREKQWRAELIGPLVCFSLLIAAKETSGNEALKLVSIEFLPMSILVTCRSITTMMIAEKSERQKEIQKIMGMKQSAYVLGWFISNLLRIFTVQAFFLILTLSTGSLPAVEGFNVWMIIASYIMYGLAQTAVAYFLTTLFDVPKTGGDVSMFMNLIGSVCSQLLQTSFFVENTWILYLLSIFPSFAYDIIPLRLVCPYCRQNKDYDTGDYFMMLGVDIIGYSLLYLYLDQVLPNEYGTNKHPLFLFGYSYNQKQSGAQESQNNVSMMQINKPLTLNESYTQEDTSSALYHETFDNPRGFRKAVFIDNLKKHFESTKAVDGLTLSIYENQILCLLGHNGAGKTTTLSLLTGLIKKDSGTIFYSGKSTDEYLDEIRTYIGICPQKDVLYDSLTVDEHLEYFGKIKGVPDGQLEQEINVVTVKCALQQERGKLAKQLSGGNRRKLCLAMALIGNSRVIFLDEPTSGMDPVSRRKIWDILIQLKNEGKCLVLTTHHLDEAEVLSERIAIMARGRLLTVGSVDFVKRNFGIGYHLNLYNLNNNEQEWEQKSRNLRKLILQNVPVAKENPQTANECVSFQVPFDQKEGFLNIFQYLENDNSVQISLMMNTLEEAFINIGMDEEQFLKKTRRFSTSQIAYQENQDQAIPVNELEDFSNIIAPECLKRSSEYSFGNQLYACLLRKLYGMQGKRLVVQLIVPTIFILFGPLFTKIYKSQFYLPNMTEKETQAAYEAWALFSISSSTGDVIFGISIAAASIAGVPILERQKKQKYALNVMGCRVMPYWSSNFLFDYAVFLILLVAYISFVYGFDAEPLKSFQNFSLTGLCLMSYIPLSYLLSWLFSDFQMALRLIVMIEIFILYIIPWCVYFFVDNEVSRWAMVIFFPSVTYFAGALIGNAPTNQDFISEWWPMALILIFQTLIYFVLNILIDQKSLQAAVSQDAIVQSNDSDVLREAQRVEKFDCNDRVIARKITKTYANGYQAVKGTSFGVRQGEIFGLLGPNGAGKSTTFNMITSRLKPTQGKIYLEQQEVIKQSEIFQNVGICPQQDSLFELLTPVQHLRIWAYLKGLSGKEAEDSVEYFLKVMQLKLYVDTPSDKLSGGNKRKLCVSLALIGGSNMQFFDEPSSGVDPIARRYLWNTIQQGIQLRQSAVILTTHTMDEAESLCSKIAIQVNGKFACMGTPQSLREKFGDGYRVTVTLYKDDDQEGVDKMIKAQFIGCEIQEEEYLKITYRLPKQGFSFYKSFNFFLKTLQQQQLIKDFQLNQTTLEQIFMYFASLQDQVPELKDTNKNRSIFASCMGNDEDD